MQGKQIKTIGTSGQISLGKEYAGRPVLIEKIEEGVWLIKTAKIIPYNEIWLHAEPVKSRIEKAIRWADKKEPTETDLEALDANVR